METFVFIGLTLSLLAITYEDLKTRSVHIYWFALTFICLGYFSWRSVGLQGYTLQYGINLIFLLLYFVLLQLYFIVKHRGWVWLFDRYIGWGDVVFLMCIAGYWNLVGFIVFIVASLMISLVVYFINIKSYERTIPLAGLQSTIFLIIFYLEEINFISLDELIYRLF
ncbi:hypothetical protein [Sphingobacterium cavernae]|uniref:hypothetical protein n=1 Tax=Sphingobacterium cavernae TaxID=2592657 RepID=UPI00122FDD28|nr:hypothetical protein [Sphingobacterium cavernae]